MIELEQATLRFRFPEVHQDADCGISFFSTLRIPDDGHEYPLPPGFSKFPLKHVDDYTGAVPDSWGRHGGVFLPMYQSEAMWLSFSGDYPMAVKIATGKVSALTGEPWHDRLSQSPDQDYVVIPEQPWLDGFYSGKGLIRQFVAMPLGEGYTAEEQITGKDEHGGLQIVAYPMKAEEYERRRLGRICPDAFQLVDAAVMSQAEMGLAPGGLMRQEIYEDPFGLSAWDKSAKSRCFVHIVNSFQYFLVTHERPPTRSPTAKEYTDAGLPWFDYYDAEHKALASSTKLLKLKSVATMKAKDRRGAMPDNETVSPSNVIKLSKKGPSVREGEF
jgi:hypothetical protein